MRDDQTLPKPALGSFSISSDEGNKVNIIAECAIITLQIETRVLQVGKRGKLKLELKEILGVSAKT